MGYVESLDLLVKRRLRRWGQRPPGVKPRSARDAWLRGRPSDETVTNPFLKLPGSTHMRTLPDGLWINFGGTVAEPYVDILAIEACSTLQNLLDKRSRFAPSTHSLLCVCPLEWLLSPCGPEELSPRWKVSRVFAREPVHNVSIPVREMRVLYGLKPHHYEGFAQHQLPHAHEFFVPMTALTAENSEDNPALQALLARASLSANFLSSY